MLPCICSVIFSYRSQMTSNCGTTGVSAAFPFTFIIKFFLLFFAFFHPPIFILLDFLYNFALFNFILYKFLGKIQH